MRARRLLGWGLAGIALLLAIAVVALPGWIDRWAAAALDARVSGTTQLSLQPLWSHLPGVRVQALRWRAPAGQAGGITVGELQARTTWAAPADGRALEAHLRDVRIDLHQSADGRWWLPHLRGDGEDGGNAPVRLTRADIDTLRLRLHPHDAPVVEVTVAQAMVIAEADGWRVALNGDIARAGLRAQGGIRARLVPGDDGLRVDGLELDARASQAGVTVPSLQFRVDSIAVSHAGVVALGAARLDALVRMPAGDDALTLGLRTHAARLENGQLTARVEALRVARGGASAAQLELHDTVVVADAAQVSASPLRGVLSAPLPPGRADVAFTEGMLRYALAAQRVTLTDLRLTATAPDPAKAGARIEARATLAADAMLDPLRASGTAAVALEGSTLDAHWRFDPAKATPLALRARVDRLDLDRWLAPAADADAPAPLAVWRDWPLRAELQVGTLIWQGVRVKQAHLVLGADGDDDTGGTAAARPGGR